MANKGCGDFYFVRETRRPNYDKGVKITLRVATQRDLNRLVFTSQFTRLTFVELDFKNSSKSLQEGAVTTVEGLIDRCITDLNQDQSDVVISQLHALKKLEEPFTLILEDNAGTTHVLNPYAPLKDPACEVTHFRRTEDQNRSVGLYPGFDETKLKPTAEGEFTLEHLAHEVLKFTVDCPNCKKHCIADMKTSNFKDLVILATKCEACGHKINEVRSGSGVETQGIRMEIVVKGKENLNRDVLMSKTCGIEMPELELKMTSGSKLKTIREIIEAMKDQQSSPATVSQLVDVLDGKKEVTIVLDDPAGKSYIQNLADDGLKITRYNRTKKQNENLGITDANE